MYSSDCPSSSSATTCASQSRSSRVCGVASDTAWYAVSDDRSARPSACSTASPISVVEAGLDAVRREIGRPDARLPARSAMARSTRSASRASPRVCRSSMATDAMAPSGLARFCPAMSGAEPWTGSYRSTRPADGRRRQHADRSGERGRLIAQDVAEQVLGQDDVEVRGLDGQPHRARVDVHVLERARPDSPSPTSVTVARQSCEVSSTFALSTEVTSPRRSRASSKATRATRTTSSRV